jgi:predicted HicB family RNase H-like nuclease
LTILHLGAKLYLMAEQDKTTETSRTIIVRLSIDTHKALRVRVAEQDTSIQKWVETLIERELGLLKEQTA